MFPKQSILAFLFLFIFSLGFTHAFIPYCEADGFINSESNRHQHEHHQHSGSAELSDHEHVKHNDHFDEGFLDLLVCLISDLNSQNDGCVMSHCSSVTLPENFDKGTLDIFSSAILFVICELHLFDTSNQECIEKGEDQIFSPIKKAHKDRGPPIFFC